MRAQVPLQHSHARIVRHERRVQTRRGHRQPRGRRVAPSGGQGRHRVRRLDSRRVFTPRHRVAHGLVQSRDGQERGDHLGAQDQRGELIVHITVVHERGEGTGAKGRVRKRERHLGRDRRVLRGGGHQRLRLRLGDDRARQSGSNRFARTLHTRALIAPFAPTLVVVLLFFHGGVL